MTSGFFKVDRGIWTDPSFSEEKFTEREAWMWLISEAAYMSRQRRVNGKLYELERSQLVAAVRFMAVAWKWSPASVSRFLGRLADEGRIVLDTETGISVITICNFDIFTEKSPVPETATTHDRNTAETKDKKEINKEEINTHLSNNRVGHSDEEGESAAQHGFTVEILGLAERICTEIEQAGGNGGQHIKKHLRSAKQLQIVERWLSKLGLTAEQILQTVRTVMQRKPSSTSVRSFAYFSKSMEQLSETQDLHREQPTHKLAQSRPVKSRHPRRTSSANKEDTQRQQLKASAEKIIRQVGWDVRTTGQVRHKSSADSDQSGDDVPEISRSISRVERLPPNHPERLMLDAARNGNPLIQAARADRVKDQGKIASEP